MKQSVTTSLHTLAIAGALAAAQMVMGVAGVAPVHAAALGGLEIGGDEKTSSPSSSASEPARGGVIAFDGIGSVVLDSAAQDDHMSSELSAFLDEEKACAESHSRIADRLDALRDLLARSADQADRVTQWMQAREREIASQDLSILEELVLLRQLRRTMDDFEPLDAETSLQAFHEDLARIREDRGLLFSQTLAEARRINRMIASVRGGSRAASKFSAAAGRPSNP